MNIDVHFHYMPQEYLEVIKSPKGKQFGDEYLIENNREFIRTQYGFWYELQPGFSNQEARLKEMDRMKLDKVLLSASPTIFHYDKDVSMAVELNQMINDSIHKQACMCPQRFVPMGTVPLQSIDEAVKEVKRCVAYGFRFIQIGANFLGIQFDDPRFLPFFEICEKLNIIILIHPYNGLEGKYFQKYYLTNLLSFPMETSLAAVSLIFGGVLDKFPNLKFILCHGGGVFPYLFGRLAHGYAVRTETKVNHAKEPKEYLNRFYFDTMVYDEKQLKFLIDFADADHVVIGTDYGFDMAMPDPIKFVENLDLEETVEKKIKGENVFKLIYTESTYR